MQTLDYSDGAYAVGRQYGTPLVAGVTNTNSINIEICVNPDSDYDQARANCIELVRQIMTELEIPADHVIRHYDAKRKHCPRKMLDQPQLWTDFKTALAGQAKKSGWQQEDGAGDTTLETVGQYATIGTGMRASGTGSTAPA